MSATAAAMIGGGCGERAGYGDGAMTASLAEQTLAAQLEQAGIPFQTEYEFAPEEWCRANGFLSPVRQLPRKWRADFALFAEEWTQIVSVEPLPNGQVESITSSQALGKALADSIRIEGVRQRSEKPNLLIEIDGGGYVAGRHTRGAGFEADAEKQSAAAILGYRVIRLTPKQVEDGRGLNWIRQALGLTSWERIAPVVQRPSKDNPCTCDHERPDGKHVASPGCLMCEWCIA